MDKIALFDKRCGDAMAISKSARDFATNLCDADSFVEADTYFFVGNDIIDNGKVFGEGIVSGIGEIAGKQFALAVQNFDLFKGGMSLGAAEKIIKIMDEAEQRKIPFVMVLSSQGARMGEGIRVLEGYSKLLRKMADLYGEIPLVSVVRGDVFGMLSMFAPLSDIVIALDNGVLCSNSPMVVSAKSQKTADAKKLAGQQAIAKAGLAQITCKDTELKWVLENLFSKLYNDNKFDEQTLNSTCEALNQKYSINEVLANVFDKDSFLETSKAFADEVKTGLATIGGETVGAVLFGEKEDGEVLTVNGCKKINKIANFCANFDIPLVTFVNCKGLEASVEAENAGIIRESALLFATLSTCQNLKISVVANVASGSIYSMFVSREIVDYSFAFATAKISLLPTDASVELLYQDEIKNSKNPDETRATLIEKFNDVEADVWNFAVSGNIDNIVEPGATRQYLLSILYN